MSQTLNSLRFRITKRFGAKTVLDDFALEVRGRQFVTLLGPSGCGKSTALNIVAGLIPASEGELWIDGARMDQLPAEQRGFGMVFQNYALFPHMTVFGNIAFATRGAISAAGTPCIRRPKPMFFTTLMCGNSA